MPINIIILDILGNKLIYIWPIIIILYKLLNIV